MLSLHNQFYLIDDAKVRQKSIQAKLFHELFANTGLILDLSQRNLGNLDLYQKTRKIWLFLGISLDFHYLCQKFGKL